MRALPEASLADAIRVRDALPRNRNDKSTPLWSDYAVSLLEERILRGDIASEATKERWSQALTHYIIPYIGAIFVDEVDKTIEALDKWVLVLARWMKEGKPSIKALKKDPKSKTRVEFKATTANGVIRLLKSITAAARKKFRLTEDPGEHIAFFREKSKFTARNPNSLSSDLLREWLDLARKLYPQHYAIMFLGFITGRRPGELRALRKIDLNVKTHILSVERSNGRKKEIKGTKTGEPVYVKLPKTVVDILTEHMRTLPAGPMRDSPLMFPGTHGDLRSRSGLDKPFKRLQKELGLRFKITPKGMRRSFQDLGREADLNSLVKRSISGHKTEKMEEHYSTVYNKEQEEGLSRMVELIK